MLRFATAAICLAGLALPASAAEFSASFGWEDGSSTIFGVFPPGSVTSANVSSGSELDYGPSGSPFPTPQSYSPSPIEGSRMLQVTESDVSGDNPRPVLAWVDGLVAGDTVSYSFKYFDPSDGRSPSALPDAVYTNTDANSFAGFATPFQDFDDFPGSGWLELQADFDGDTPGIQPVLTFDPGTDRTGVALRSQLFAPSLSEGVDGNDYKFFLDDIQVTVNSSSPDARIVFADGSEVLVPEPASLTLLAAGGLLTLARRRRSA